MTGRALGIVLVAFGFMSAPAAAYVFTDVVTHGSVGTGANEAMFVVDFQQGHAAVFHYRWDGTKTAAEMLNDIAAGTSRLFVAWHPDFVNTGLFALGFDADGDGGSFTPGIPGVSENGSASDPDDYYHEGWFTGFWSYWTGNDGATWTPQIELGLADIIVTDGSWHGLGWDPSFVFFNLFLDPQDPEGLAVAPDNLQLVPEPASAVLLGLGSFLVLRRRRS